MRRSKNYADPELGSVTSVPKVIVVPEPEITELLMDMSGKEAALHPMM